MQAKRILLVEDEILIALDTADMVARAGFEVVGPVGEVQDALLLVEQGGLDGALLDVNLGGIYSWPVAEALAARRIPFALLTGFGAGLDVPAAFAAIPRLAKPIEIRALARALSAF